MASNFTNHSQVFRHSKSCKMLVVMLVITCPLITASQVKVLKMWIFVRLLLSKEPAGSILVIPTWQTSTSFLIFEKMCLGIGCTLGKTQISSACASCQKRKSNSCENYLKLELFPTSCPRVFLALSAAPKDLVPIEINGFLHCCAVKRSSGQSKVVERLGTALNKSGYPDTYILSCTCVTAASVHPGSELT